MGKLVSAAVTAFFPHPAQDEIGEGIGHELGTEALLVIDQDDLPEVSGGAGGQVDSELVAAVAPKAYPAGGAGQALHRGVGRGADRMRRTVIPAGVTHCRVDAVQVLQAAELAADRIASAVRLLEIEAAARVHPCHPVQHLELIGQRDTKTRFGSSDLLLCRSDGARQPLAQRPLQQLRIRRWCRHCPGHRIGTAEPGLGKGAVGQDEHPQVRVAESRFHDRARPNQAERGPPVRLDLRPERDLLDSAARERPLYVLHRGPRCRRHGPPIRKARAVLADAPCDTRRPGGTPIRVAGQHEPQNGLPGREFGYR